MQTTWHARLDWVSATSTSEDTVFDLMDELTNHAPSGSIARDGLAGTLTIAVEADSFDDALSSALGATRAALQRHVPTANVVGVELVDSDVLERELDRPLFPEVVGFAEIAELAGVSRQRARQLRDSPGFPAPVIETAQGPLMAKAAIENWLESRNTRPGRRPTSS
ncbi:helix-turn-helix transcriptional regulator [Brachybacterium paraconglomeratum]|uniref:helix-turn-helix transcriptional regulator n=1 Tax=Brachybacterium paraconglomeratum TaxID=173362 RepID=UPI0022AFFBE7|nr:hypothetical protein [Brachybacterium paraconglomeratum]MCZ4325657.1 hypothetical protein [Brachybacterium paraconglomeratum]